MDIDAIPNFLSSQRDNAPDDLQHYFLTFEDYWERKLWHELTDSLIEFYETDSSAAQRLDVYRTFICSFSDKINQLKFVRLGLNTAKQCKDDEERLSFLKKLSEKVNKPSSQDAYVYALTAVANIQLQLSDLTSARTTLDKCEAILDNFDSVDSAVHASFYRESADYYQRKQDFGSYYRTTLLYLACIDTTSLSSPPSSSSSVSDLSTPESRQKLAYNLSLSALVSTSIYNFGELLLHPLLSSLISTPESWLRELLLSFNAGDSLSAHASLSSNIHRDALLSQHSTFLYEKISLAALTEAVFRSSPSERADMSFKYIAERTKVKEDEVEYLVMKALSLGLVKGKIDQVGHVARFDWVQPKVLDMDQIKGLKERLRDWDSGVNKLGNWIEGVGKDVWAV